MLFVTIACGAISGWHALVGSVGTARQLEYETDGLPVGGGSMFGEYTLALLSLVAVSIAGVGGGGGRLAAGVGKLIYAGTFKAIPEVFGTALGLGAFVVIVLTVTQLVFRVMRVTLTEWAGEAIPLVRNMHVSSIISMLLTLALVMTGTWVYLWQMFGASNQLMAALSLLVVTVWLKSGKEEPELRPLPDALHVRHDALRHGRHGPQPLCDDRSEPGDERAAGRRRVGDDRPRGPSDHRGPLHRVGRPEGLPEVQRDAGGREAGPRDRLGPERAIADHPHRREHVRGGSGLGGQVDVELQVGLGPAYGEAPDRQASGAGQLEEIVGKRKSAFHLVVDRPHAFGRGLADRPALVRHVAQRVAAREARAVERLQIAVRRAAELPRGR